MAAATSTTKMSLKLVVDTKAERVLFAEASKDFIDFLFNLQRLPIGAVTKLLTKTNMIRSLGKIYESIENLSEAYLLAQNQDKDILLKPKTLIPPGYFLLSNYEGVKIKEEYEAPKVYMCCWNRCKNYATMVEDTKCPHCGSAMNDPLTYVGKNEVEVKLSVGGEGGFVKEGVTYMVTDDLMVQPMSTVSYIALLNKFNIKDISSLQEMVVDFGMHEGMELLKASLHCAHPLTSVFHRNIKFKKESNIILH